MGARVSAAVLCLGLAGCQATASAPETALAPDVAPLVKAAPFVNAPFVNAPFVKQEGVSLADATVAMVSLEGAPEAAAADFRAALSRRFDALGVVAAPGAKARYRLRVYLSASAAADGAALDYVVDVYDGGRVREARLSDSFAVKGSGDAWSLMSSEAVGSVAEAAAENVAGFLSQAPEAKPAARLAQ